MDTLVQIQGRVEVTVACDQQSSNDEMKPSAHAHMERLAFVLYPVNSTSRQPRLAEVAHQRLCHHSTVLNSNGHDEANDLSGLCSYVLDSLESEVW